MLIPVLKSMFERDLNRLYFQISNFDHEANIWRVDDGVSNSAGNLTLHIIGNLNTFIGAELGGTDYVRDRQYEFGAKDVPTESLLSEISNVKQLTMRVLDTLEESQLDEIYPRVVFKEPMTTKFFLIHLTTHLAYHLGQVNYYRRLFDK